MSFCEAIATTVCDVLKMCIFHEAVASGSTESALCCTANKGPWQIHAQIGNLSLKIQTPAMEEQSDKVAEFDEDGRSRKKYRITVEPLSYFFVTAVFCQVIINQNLLLDKVCRVNFNLSASQCNIKSHHGIANHSANHSSLIDQVQSYVSVLNIYASLITNIPPVFVVLFLGPWSDKNGRRPIMLIPIVGVVLSTLTYLLNYLAESWPAEYILFANVPVGLCGGIHTFLMAINSYLVDITTEENRTLRLAIMGGTITIAIPVANFLATVIFKYGGYMCIYGTALGFLALAFIYVFLFVNDSKGKKKKTKLGTTIQKLVIQKEVSSLDSADPSNNNNMDHTSCLSIITNLWKCFTITFRPRPGYQRTCVALLLVSLCFALFSNASHGITYLYTRKKFGWDVPEFSLYLVCETSLAVLGTFIVLPIMSNYLKIRDAIIGIVSLLGQAYAYMLVAFAVTPLMMYLSTLGMFLYTGLQVVIRSLLSKIVGRDDMSCVYAVAACLESVMPLIASPFFNLIYIGSLDSFLGTSFVFESFIQIFQILFFALVLYFQEKDAKLSVVRPIKLESAVSVLKFD